MDLDGYFGLGVVDAQFAATGAFAEGDAEFPRWFWFLGGIIAPEQVAAFLRNRWQDWAGLRSRAQHERCYAS